MAKNTCTICGVEFAERRAALGYKTCLPCGEGAAKQERSGWTIGAPHKQGYTLITNKADLIGLNNKTTP